MSKPDRIRKYPNLNATYTMRYSCLNRTRLTAIFSCIIIGQLFFNTTAHAQMRQVYVDNVEDNQVVRMSFYTPAEGYVAFFHWIGHTVDSGHTFTRKYITLNNVDYGTYSVNLTFGFVIKGVQAFDQNTILVYGDYGLVPSILRSTDGGNTFTLIYHSRYLGRLGSIVDMVFPQNSPAIGFAIDQNRILKTTNGGQTWTVDHVYISVAPAFTNTEIDLTGTYVTVFGASTSANVIRVSNSSFTGWSSIPVPAGMSIRSAFFQSVTVGWINVRDNNDRNLIYKTVDGGTNWTLISDPDATQFAGYDMLFIDASVGYARLGDFTIYKTLNGGHSWEPLLRDNNFEYLNYGHNDVHYRSANQFWTGGGHGFLEMTTNGGGTPLPKAYFKIDTTGMIPGGNVDLINFSNPAYQSSWYINGVYIGNSYNTSYTHQFNRGRDTIKLVVSNGQYSDTLEKYPFFPIAPVPTITSFSPSGGSAGTLVTINGIDFTGVYAVSIGGVPVSSFTVVSPTLITAIVGSGGTGGAGNIGLTSMYGTFLYPGFTYFPPPVTPPPVITSFSPTSGIIGTTVTIEGSNFNPDPAANIVYFGATMATVSSASNTQLVCTVPAGASFQPLSVLNTGSTLTGYSAQPFNVLFADSSDFNEGSFQSVLAYSQPYNVMGFVDAADIDGDGKPDLVSTVRSVGDSIHIRRNTSTGGNFSFASPVNPSGNVDFGSGVANVTLQDIDSDGKPDMISTTNKSYVHAYRNTSTIGNISFESFVQIPMGSGSSQNIAMGDLDNDGKPDLAVSGFGNKSVSIIRNTSTPGILSFGASTNYLSAANVKRVAIADLDADGKRDVLALNYISGGGASFSYFKNQSSGSNIILSGRTDIAVPGDVQQGGHIHIVDFDGDNKMDVIILTGGGHSVFRNISTNGVIALAPMIHYPATPAAMGSTAANLSGDARPDLVAGHHTLRRFFPIRNTSVIGDIAIEPGIEMPVPSPTHIGAADFNLDGKPDLVIGSFSDNKIVLFKNTVRPTAAISLCAGENTSFSADLSSATAPAWYQWQVDTGTGFMHFNNDTHYSGVTTSVLSIQNIPSAWYGYEYRCAAHDPLTGDIKYSGRFKLKFEARWTGSVSNEWSNPLNWDCGILPDGNTDVIVQTGNVLVNADGTCRTLTLAPGVNFTVGTGVSFIITH